MNIVYAWGFISLGFGHLSSGMIYIRACNESSRAIGIFGNLNNMQAYGFWYMPSSNDVLFKDREVLLDEMMRGMRTITITSTVYLLLIVHTNLTGNGGNQRSFLTMMMLEFEIFAC